MGCDKCGGGVQQYCDNCEEEYKRLNNIDDDIEFIKADITKLAADPALIDVLESIMRLLNERL